MRERGVMRTPDSKWSIAVFLTEEMNLRRGQIIEDRVSFDLSNIWSLSWKHGQSFAWFKAE